MGVYRGIYIITYEWNNENQRRRKRLAKWDWMTKASVAEPFVVPCSMMRCFLRFEYHNFSLLSPLAIRLLRVYWLSTLLVFFDKYESIFLYQKISMCFEIRFKKNYLLAFLNLKCSLISLLLFMVADCKAWTANGNTNFLLHSALTVNISLFTNLKISRNSDYYIKFT